MIPSETTLTRMSGIRSAMTGVLATVTAVVAALVMTTGASAADPLQVQVGVGVGQVEGQAFLPGKVTVEAGSSVTFTIGSDVPHSVTFGKGPDDVAPALWPVAGWSPQEATQPTMVDMGAVTVAGDGFLNTGPLYRGSSATVTFTTPGVYTVTSVLDPGMEGEVEVVEVGAGGVTTQADADAAATASTDALLGQAEAVRSARLADVESVKNADGTTTWNIFADAASVANVLPGGGTGYLQLYEMVPAALAVGVGDTVHWSALGTNNVAFPASGQDPLTIDAVGLAAGSDVYDGTALASSGLLNSGRGSPSAYSLTFPKAGTFEYVSAPYQALGQRGVIAVGQPLPSAAVPASEVPGSGAPAPSASPGG